MILTITNKQRTYFLSHINKTNTCWLWTGAVMDKGYGYFSKPKKYAHNRVAWLVFNNQDPGIMDVLHKCDTPLCVNPEHLFLGTQGDNARDMVDKSRHARGEYTNRTNLTAQDVYNIKQWRRRLSNLRYS